MTTSLILPEGVPEGARTLGVRNSPSLRLSIGFRNPERGNAPDKLDHFRAKVGANNEFAAAARKFHDPEQGYGPTPRAIDIRLPARLEDAIRIEYLAFKGNRDDPLGGVMVARGNTNFAPLGHCGGPDTLTVWDEDGTVRQVQTKGVDAVTKQPLDMVAQELGLMLCTTFCVGLPKILGFGSHAEITSKSLKSTDQVWKKLVEWYAAFPNGTITWAMCPLLVVKPAVARPVVDVKKDGKVVGRKRIRSLVYVLDVVQPESEDEMIRRLEKYHGAVAPAGALQSSAPLAIGAAPDGDVEDITDAEIEVEQDSGPGDHLAAEMLSPEQPGPEQALDAAEAVATPAPSPDEAATSEPHQGPAADAGVGGVEQDAIPPLASGDASQQADVAHPSAPGDVGAEPVLEEEAPAAAADEITDDDRRQAEQAGRMKPPWGSYQTRTLATIVKNAKGEKWLEYAVKQSVAGKIDAKDARFERALWSFIRVNLPTLYETYKEHAK